MIKKFRKCLLTSFLSLYLSLPAFALNDDDLNQINEATHRLQVRIDEYKQLRRLVHRDVLPEDVELGPDATLDLEEQRIRQKSAVDAVIAYYQENKNLTTDRNAMHLGSQQGLLGIIIAFDHIESKKHSIIWCSYEEWQYLKEHSLKDHLRYLRWKDMEALANPFAYD